MKRNQTGTRNQITGNIGLYYCCYHLSKRGWNVMPTNRNAKGIDIVAYNKDATRYIGIQVKTLSARPPVPLGETLEKVMGDYWIIVNNAATDSPQIYILYPFEVKSLAHRGVKGRRVSYWLDPKNYETKEYHNAWTRIDELPPQVST